MRQEPASGYAPNMKCKHQLEAQTARSLPGGRSMSAAVRAAPVAVRHVSKQPAGLGPQAGYLSERVGGVIRSL